MKRLTDQQKAEMIQLYTTGKIKIPRALDEKYGVYPGSCYFILKRRGLIKYSNADQHRLFNENYFEKIETEKQAYFLGLLAADGSISEKRNTITLSLVVNDGLDIINEFKKELNSKGAVSIRKDKRDDYKRKDMITINFTSKKTKEDLQKLGLTHRKTNTLNYPSIDSKLDRHFIRGFIDGDGCFYYKRNKLCTSIVGTESILSKIQTVLLEKINIPKTKLYRHKTGVFYLQIAHKNTIALRKWIYENCQIALKRKKELKETDPNYVQAIKKTN